MWPLTLLAVVALGGCANLDRDDLASYVDELHSSSVEGQQVARQLREHRMPTMFAWIETAQLWHQAEELGKRIDGEMVGSGLGPEVEQAKVLIDRAKLALAVLHERANRPQAAARAAAVLGRMARQSQQLEEQLRQ